MAEWSIAAVLKTVVPRGTWGSNPYFSASKAKATPHKRGFLFLSSVLIYFSNLLNENKNPFAASALRNQRATGLDRKKCIFFISTKNFLLKLDIMTKNRALLL